MRVVVATDVIAGLSPQAASETIGHAFASRDAQVVVVPLGVDGDQLASAVGTAAPDAVFAAPRTGPDLGAVLAGHRDERPLVVDLTHCAIDDLGRSALAAFGEEPAPALASGQGAWRGRSLVALVPQEQAARPLTGLEGHASTEMRAAGATLQEILEFDADAERWAQGLSVEPGPGAGAAGGAGLIIAALGGRVVDPLTWLADSYRLNDTIAKADLVVTGAELLEFHEVGGPVVKRVIGWAEEQLRPVIAIAGRNFVSARELRTAGLENAYPLRERVGEEPSTPEELARVAERVATSWTW